MNKMINHICDKCQRSTDVKSAVSAGFLLSFFILWLLWSVVGTNIVNWLECNDKLASWAQAGGAIVALTIAIWIPWNERQSKIRDDRKRAADDSDITIRFHTELLDTNEEMLRVALGNIPEEYEEVTVYNSREVLSAIKSLRAIGFDQIKIIASHNPKLARYLADFHCELEFLNGIIKRNKNDENETINYIVFRSAKERLKKLETTAMRIRELTFFGANPA